MTLKGLIMTIYYFRLLLLQKQCKVPLGGLDDLKALGGTDKPQRICFLEFPQFLPSGCLVKRLKRQNLLLQTVHEKHC